MSEIKIMCGDSLKIMQSFPDKYFDCVITDPPYGLGIDGQKESFATNPKHNRKKHPFMGWDSKIPSKKYFDEMFRISKNQIIWGGNYFVDYFTEGHKGWLVWDKGQRGLTMSDGELAYSSFDSALRIFTFNRSILKTDGAHHPTMKPLELMRWCVEYSGAKSVIDPFMGSGTTILAAKQLGVNALGIDIAPEYVEKARNRLAQQQLF